MESPPKTPPKKRSFSPFDFTFNKDKQYMTEVVDTAESTTQTQSLDMDSPHPLERGDSIVVDNTKEVPVDSKTEEVPVDHNSQEVPVDNEIKAVGSYVLEYKLGGGTVVSDCRRSPRHASCGEPSSK
jgi:hypothetical protein